MIEVVKIKERIRSHLLSHTTVPEVFQAADSDFREAETVCQTIGEAFLPPLLLTGDGFCIQTQRIAFPASGRESAWNHGSVRITFSVFPV